MMTITQLYNLAQRFKSSGQERFDADPSGPTFQDLHDSPIESWRIYFAMTRNEFFLFETYVLF